MTSSDGGKGSDRRPGKGYGDGWDRIFGGKKEELHRSAPNLHLTCSEGSVRLGAMCEEPPQGGSHIATACKTKVLEKSAPNPAAPNHR